MKFSFVFGSTSKSPHVVCLVRRGIRKEALKRTSIKSCKRFKPLNGSVGSLSESFLLRFSRSGSFFSSLKNLPKSRETIKSLSIEWARKLCLFSYHAVVEGMTSTRKRPVWLPTAQLWKAIAFRKRYYNPLFVY